MRNPQKENQPSTLNQPIQKHKKNNQNNRLTLKEHIDYYDKIAILKQSALQALAQKNEVIQSLTNSLNHQQQLACSLSDQKAEDNFLFDVLLAKINEKSEEAQQAWLQVKKKGAEMQRLKDQMENEQWQRQQLLEQLEKYEVQNQDLRQIINELVAQNQRFKELFQQMRQHQQGANQQRSIASSLADSAAKQNNRNINASENCRNLHSAQQSKLQSQLRENRSPALNVLLFQRTNSIAEFTNLCQENELIDFHEHSVTPEMKESLVKKHCLALSLKAINLIDTYSLNSTSKKVTDYESQLTARYFHYVNQKDIDRGCCQANSVDLQMQSYEDIVEQPEEQQAEEQVEIKQTPAKLREQNLFNKLKWTAFGLLVGSTLTLLLKR